MNFLNFRQSLKAKLIISFIILIILLSGSFLAFSLTNSVQMLHQSAVKRGKILVEDLGYASELGILANDSSFVERSTLRSIQKENIFFAAVYDNNGNILNSQITKKSAQLKKHLPPALMKKLANQREPIWYSKKAGGEKMYEFFAAIRSRSNFQEKQRIIGYSHIAISLGQIRKETRNLITLYLGVTSVFLVLGGFTVYYLSERITSPLNRLTRGVEEISSGNFNYRTDIKAENEFGKLGEAFNQMAENIQQKEASLEEQEQILRIRVKARTRQLREQAQDLEHRVEQRTKELQDRLEELERFHKLAVGREMKMIDLKKQIKKLKDKLKAKQEKIESLQNQNNQNS